MNKKATTPKKIAAGTVGPYDEIEELIDKHRKKRKEKAAGFCPACGKPVLVSDRFCSSCGKPIKK